MHRTIKAQRDSFPLKSPFRISRGVRTIADVVTVTINDGDGLIGRGEGVPYSRYQESVEDALASVESVRADIEAGAGREDLLRLLPPGSARTAIDCALWDLEARQAGRSVAALLGLANPPPVASALTIVIDTPEAMRAAAAALADAPLLKIKVDAEDPASRIKAVREAAPKAKLIVDPNESWDRSIIEAMEPVLLEVGVSLLEQPVPADADEWLADFTSAIPICADEAVHVAKDLDRVARLYQVVNVKLDKSGGLTAGLELARSARARGLGLMTGCMISSSLSIAPAFHVAAMSDFVDLDGPIWLSNDRPGGVSQKEGMLVPPSAGFWGEP